MISSRIEPETFRLETEYPNKLCYRVPHQKNRFRNFSVDERIILKCIL
jgi:hypothetical protein